MRITLPKHNEPRIIRKFILLPKTYGRYKSTINRYGKLEFTSLNVKETRFLKFSPIVQRYCGDKKKWETIGWDYTEEDKQNNP